MSAPATFYNQQSSYGLRQGYVVPPQDMPPKNGFFFPKYRMSTLTAKGLTTFQIVGVFLGACIYGTMQLIDHSEWRNARSLSQTTQLFAQSSLFSILYGRPERLSKEENPLQDITLGINLFPQVSKGRDRRPEMLVSSIMADDRRRRIDLWRLATRDTAVAPYQVCYGPEHYKGNHVCNQYCILPAEVRAAKKIIEEERATAQKQHSATHHH